MERKLANRKTYTNDSAIEIVHNGTTTEKAKLAMALGFDCPDYGFAQAMCIQLLQCEEENVRTNAVIGLAHIARRFGKLDKRVLKPYLLRELKENNSGREGID